MKKEVLDEYEKVRRDTYTPLVERVPKERHDQIFIFFISCGTGWKDIVFKLIEDLDRIWTGYKKKAGRDAWKLLQVKEKFGGLRFYPEFPEEETTDAKARKEQSYAAIDFAETQAWKTCERCGKPGHTTSVHYYIATVCDVCEERMKARSKKGMTPTLFG